MNLQVQCTSMVAGFTFSIEAEAKSLNMVIRQWKLMKGKCRFMKIPNALVD
jgi:hypothetical protein